MMKEKSSWKLIGTGIITAIAASLCCITPVLALFAGASGIASGFSWLEPARPYLIAATILVLGFAWFQKLKKSKSEMECCVVGEKPKFYQSKAFLGLVTIFALLMLAFPYYSKVFFPQDKKVVLVDKSNAQTAEFKISGMSCEGCTEEVKHEVNKLDGIIKADVSYENEVAQIQFDKSKTNIAAIEKAINSTGYKVTQRKLIN